jgi:hypothetical protein
MKDLSASVGETLNNKFELIRQKMVDSRRKIKEWSDGSLKSGVSGSSSSSNSQQAKPTTATTLTTITTIITVTTQQPLPASPHNAVRAPCIKPTQPLQRFLNPHNISYAYCFEAIAAQPPPFARLIFIFVLLVTIVLVFL